MKATLNICLLAVLLTVHTALATKDTQQEDPGASSIYSMGYSAPLASVVAVVVFVGLAFLSCCLKKKCSQTTTFVPANLQAPLGRTVQTGDEVYLSASTVLDHVVLQMPQEVGPKTPVEESSLCKY